MASIRLSGVEKRYRADEPPAVSDLDLEIADGEFFVLLGPSGCGKSTLLRLIAGLEEADAGEIWLDTRVVNYDPPGRRDIAMVFQSYALYPHMTVRQNLEFPLRMRRTPRDSRQAGVSATAEMLELDDLMGRKVSTLSGGQRQRVAVGRAIIREPSALLMDEPLSNLDALLRFRTREQLLTLHRQTKQTIIYVTHDQVEAMTMGDRIAVMKAGRIVQIGTPAEIYDLPEHRFVAGFMGAPPMNLLDGELRETDTGPCFRVDGLKLAFDGEYALERDAFADVSTIGVRPESVEVLVLGGSDAGWKVELVENLGPDRIFLLRKGAVSLRVRSGASVNEGATVAIRLPSNAVHLFDQAGQRVAAGRTAGANATGP